MWSDTPDKGSRKLGSALNYPNLFAGVAQLEEQLICNQPVGGSGPSTSARIARTPVYIGRVLTLSVRNQD